MQSDVLALRGAQKRLALDAESFLASQAVDASALSALMKSHSFILTLDEVRSALAESSKLPPPDPIHKEHGSGAHTDGLMSKGEAHGSMSASQSPQASSSNSDSPLHEKAEPERKSIETIVSRSPTYKPLAKEYAPRIKIREHTDVSGQSRCVGTVDDFVAYFRDRFERESMILRQHQTNLSTIRVDQISQHTGEEVRLVVMVSDRRITHNGNLFMEVEDEYGQMKAIFTSKERNFPKARGILKDDVIAIDGRMGPNFFSIKDITYPDIPLLRPTKTLEEDLAIAYLSDIHVGSKLFLEKSFRRFVRWLWGEEGREELAGKVKYVVIAGDVCDGIGVYPAQEKELSIKDIYEQYAAFDKLMELMPDWVEVIVSPGNHDGVRRGEPQPIIPMELVRSDVKKIGSPAMVDIEEFRHLVYHGSSLDSVIANVPGLNYQHPENAMKEVLVRRHLSPVYGENPIVPERRDYMMIDEEPDIVHMGHLHKNGLLKYRGTWLVNSGTFQDRTDFQVRMGHVPTPGIVPVLELKSQQFYHLKFMEGGL